MDNDIILSGFFMGAPGPHKTIFQHMFTQNVIIKPKMYEWIFCQIWPKFHVDFYVLKNEISIGTVTFFPNERAISVDNDVPAEFGNGDVLEIRSGGVIGSQIGDLEIHIKGTPIIDPKRRALLEAFKSQHNWAPE
jgi:hypothetical protein